MSTKNSIQVGIKVRPLLGKDQAGCWRVVDNSIQLLDSKSESFYFDHIFDQDANNQIIFDKMAKHIVHSAIQGFNGTIFAYGQTSSGKTYTMMGDDTNPGVMVLAAKEIFKEMINASDRQFLLRVGYIEIYNEKIYDLLNKKNQDLKIHETNNGVSVNCEEICITCEDDLMHILNMGNKERTVGETNMNERSSRSHAIFRITIESRKVDRSEEEAVIQSVLNLVDLAGSERANQTGATGARLKEGGHINKSLMFLSNVIKNLSENEDHKYISYRDSKLTRILQASLGGNALTAIICTIKSTTIEETQSTLSFAMRAKTIKNKPQVNETVSDATMMKRLENEIKRLKLSLDEERQRNQSKFKVCQLEEQIKNSLIKIISVNSLRNVREQRETRRRTWCPASTMVESGIQLPNRAALPSSETIASSKPRPFFTPHITLRNPEPNQQATSEADIFETEEEVFVPGELCNLNCRTPPKSVNQKWEDYKTPNNNYMLRQSITPRVAECPELNLQIVENALLELQEFTNLETKIQVKHDAYDALKAKMDMLTERNSVLEGERLEHMELKEDIGVLRNDLSECRTRCDHFQIQVSKLTNANEIAAKRIAKYEEELEALRSTNKQLEMENQEAVNLDFEFQRHKKKSNIRETELLEALAEKDGEIVRLEKSLTKLSGEKFANCNDDLQKLRGENQSLAEKVETLTSEYQTLQLNYTQATAEANNAQARLRELEQLQRSDELECSKLRAELHILREKLGTVQKEYTQLNCDRIEKTEACEKLQRVINEVREESFVLQRKYDKLEEVWHQQEATIAKIQSEYDCIQTKYQKLHTEYEQLERTSASSLGDCARLKQENEQLQLEINNLKPRIEEIQIQLQKASSQSTDLEDLQDLRESNCKLKQELADIMGQFEDLQREYDQLSNQLMDSVQEGDALKDKCSKLEEQIDLLKESQGKNVQYNDLNGLNEVDSCESLRSSGIGTDGEPSSNSQAENILKFAEFLQKLHEIELECAGTGKSRIFSLKESEGTERRALDSTERAYKLLLTKIEDVTSLEYDDAENDSEKVCMQGSLKQNKFHIIEMEQAAFCYSSSSNGDAVENLQKQLQELSDTNQYLCDENKSLLESSERALHEMREQIERLSSELFEKSMFLEKCACEEYQKQIDALERERAERERKLVELQATYEKDMGELQLQMQKTEKELKDENNRLQLEFYEKLEIRESSSRDYLRQTREWEAEREQHESALLDLRSIIAEKEVLLTKCNCCSLQRELEAKSEELEVYKERHRESDLQRNEDDRIIAEKSEEISQLLQKIASYDKTNIGIVNQKEEVETELGETRRQLKEVQDVLNALDYERKCQTNGKVETEAEYNEQRQVLEEKTQEIAQLRQQIATIEDENTAIVHRKVELERELIDAQDQLKELRDVSAALGSERTTREMLQEELSQLRADLAVISSAKTELETVCELLRAEKAVMATRVDELSASVQEMKNENCQLELQLANINEAMNKLLEEKSAIHKEQEVKVTELSAIELACESLRLEKSGLQDMLKQAEVARCGVEDALSESREKVAELETALAEKTSCVVSLKTAADTLLVKRDYLEGELSKIVQDKRIVEQKLLEKCEQASNHEKQLRALHDQLQSFDEIRREKLQLEEAIESLKEEYELSLEGLRKERNQLQLSLSQQKKETNMVESKEETLRLKIDAMSHELVEANVKAESYAKLCADHDHLKDSLVKAEEEKLALTAELEETRIGLEEIKATHARQSNSEKADVNLLRERFNAAQLEVATVNEREQVLRSELHDLQEQLSEQCALQRQTKELSSAVSELQFKCDSLKQANDSLQETNGKLLQKVEAIASTTKECELLRSQLQGLQAEKGDLQHRMDLTIEEANKAGKSLREELAHHKESLEEQIKSYINLRSLLDSKEAAFKDEKSKLEGTISCLVMEKQRLEDKLHATEVALKRFESELMSVHKKADCANTSKDSNTSVSSPLRGHSIDRSITESNQLKAVNVGIEDKLTSMHQKAQQMEFVERKNRRLSSHDERRRQSVWGDTREVALMTDPTDSNCNCVDLDQKLKDCEKNLFIRESQVAALSMELRNHPLKTENAALKKRLEEEQERNLTEIRKYKQIIIEQTTKAKEPAPSKASANAECQTESELDACFQKLQGKYNDLKNICRYRYNVIRDLETKLNQKENTDANLPISSLEAGQLKSLQSQCELLKKELQKYKYKYEDAKHFLCLRLEEIRRLRAANGVPTGAETGATS